MCRQKVRVHEECGHIDRFWVIECDKFVAKKQKWLKKSFWSRLVHFKPSCKTVLDFDTRDHRCAFCFRSWGWVYPTDDFGIDLDGPNEVQAIPKGEERRGPLSGRSSHQNLERPIKRPNIRSITFDSPSQANNLGDQPLEMRSNIVDPGIDHEHLIRFEGPQLPPRSGPPPNRPLPPTPHGHRRHSIGEQHSPKPQTRQRANTNQGIPRKPVSKHSSEKYPDRDRRHFDSQPAPDPPLPRLPEGRKETYLPLILDINREVPEMAFLPEPDLGVQWNTSFLAMDEWSDQKPQTPGTRTRRASMGLSRSQEKSSGFEYPLVSPITPDTPVLRHVDGPNRQARRVGGRHENVRSVEGNVAYISPKLEETIDDVMDYWIAAGTPVSKEPSELPRRAGPKAVKQEEDMSKEGRATFDEI